MMIASLFAPILRRSVRNCVAQFLAFGLAFSTQISVAQTSAGLRDAGGTPVLTELSGRALRLTFNDEFNALVLRHGDRGVWSTSYGYGGINDFTLTQNQERQLYVDPQFAGSGKRALGLQPFSINHGVLDISADRMPAAMQRSAWNYRYYSGLLTTRRSFSQQYGYFEMRARLPATAGAWPAFWLLRPDGQWPPEIDAIEYLGRDPNVYYAGFHTTAHGYDDVPVTQRTEIPGAPGQFHTYGVLWDQDNIVWYLDHAEVRRIKTPGDMHTPMYVLVNLAIGGGGWAGAPNIFAQFPIHMSVDYVRIYQVAPRQTR